VGEYLDAKGEKLLSKESIFAKIKIDRIFRFSNGPRRHVYIMNYAGYRTVSTSTGILRIKYVGHCQPTPSEYVDTTLKYFAVGLAKNNKADHSKLGGEIFGNTLMITTLGKHSVEVHNLTGQFGSAKTKSRSCTIRFNRWSKARYLCDIRYN